LALGAKIIDRPLRVREITPRGVQSLALVLQLIAQLGRNGLALCCAILEVRQIAACHFELFAHAFGALAATFELGQSGLLGCGILPGRGKVLSQTVAPSLFFLEQEGLPGAILTLLPRELDVPLQCLNPRELDVPLQCLNPRALFGHRRDQGLLVSLGFGERCRQRLRTCTFVGETGVESLGALAFPRQGSRVRYERLHDVGDFGARPRQLTSEFLDTGLSSPEIRLGPVSLRQRLRGGIRPTRAPVAVPLGEGLDHFA
jgi:hypothetical protein